MSDATGSGGGATTGGWPVRTNRGRTPAAGLVVILLYAFVAISLVPIFPHGGSANEQTRWATAASIVDRGSFEISWSEGLFGFNPDTARVGARLYSNKAPGAAILAVPAYAAVRAVAGPPTASNMRASWTTMRWLIATLPLIGLALYFRSRRASPLGLTLALFASPLFVYSLLLFSHVLAGVAVFFAYVLLYGVAHSSAAADRETNRLDAARTDRGRTGPGRGARPERVSRKASASKARGSGGRAGASGSTDLERGTVPGGRSGGQDVLETRTAAGAETDPATGAWPDRDDIPAAETRTRMIGSLVEPPWSVLLAGLLAGISVSAEFAVVVPVLILGIGLLLRGERPISGRAGAALLFGLGGLPCALLLALYNRTLFGSFFSLSYAHEAFKEWADVAQRGVFGISLPTPANLWLLLLSPSRGLFFMAPVLVLGAVELFRSAGGGSIFRSGGGGTDTLRRRVRLSIVAGSVLVLAGHGAAHGGWAPGPRYLVFVLPFLLEALLESSLLASLSAQVTAFPSSAELSIPETTGALPHRRTERTEQARGRTQAGAKGFEHPAGRPSHGGLFLVGLLAGASIVLSVLPALTFPFAPPEFSFPHASLWRPFLADGWGTPTLGALVGLGSGPLALVPALLAILGALVVSLAPRSLSGVAIGIAAGAAIAVLYSIAPGLDEPDGPARRAAIEERFFRREGRIAAVRSRTTDPDQLRYLDLMDWQVAEVAALAPDNWPYSREPLAAERPGEVQKRASDLTQQKKLAEAEAELRRARETFAFARCDFTDDLSVVLYLSGRKDEAIAELESARPLARARTTPGCRKSLFHLGSLYREMGRPQEASDALREYLALTEGYADAETVRNRQSAAAALRPSSVQ